MSTAWQLTTSLQEVVLDRGLGGLVDPTSLGNPGYDGSHYEIDLLFEPTVRLLDATVTFTATATANLDMINVDFIGFDISSIALAGHSVEYRRSERDVIIELPGARAWFPSNDHPSDKATYTFRLTVPQPLTAVANGVLVKTIEEDERSTWVWEMGHPMATYLATVLIGDVELVDDVGSTAFSGVPIRNVIPNGYEPPEGVSLDPVMKQGEMIRFYSDLFGPYPFETYGIALVPDVPGGLETQSLPIIGIPFTSLLAHEMAHQWFGNHVSISDWRDIWLNEGMATYATWLWSEHTGETSVAEAARIGYELMSEGNLPPGDPPATDVFNQSVYIRGALGIYALRSEMGDDDFFAFLGGWIDQYGGESGSTQDFLDLAQQYSARDLTELFNAWLYQADMPALPMN